MIFHTQHSNGFTLVEMLVSVSILLLVIVGPMTITARIAKSATFATEQVQAFFLAQEGIEIAQKGRDDLLLRNFLESTHGSYEDTPWAEFIDPILGDYHFCFGSPGCGLEWHASNPGELATTRDCSLPDNCRLYRNASAERAKYTHVSTGGTPTLFTRKIYMTATPAGDPNAVRVRSVVTWRTGSVVAEQQVEVESYLYNIYDTD